MSLSRKSCNMVVSRLCDNTTIWIKYRRVRDANLRPYNLKFTFGWSHNPNGISANKYRRELNFILLIQVIPQPSDGEYQEVSHFESA